MSRFKALMTDILIGSIGLGMIGWTAFAFFSEFPLWRKGPPHMSKVQERRLMLEIFPEH